MPQTPIPGLGLDSIAPGLGTQTIPDALVKVTDSRRFAATIDVDGEHINVAYTDSDDLATYVLEHPGANIVSPQEAVDAFHRRLKGPLRIFSPSKNTRRTPTRRGTLRRITSSMIPESTNGHARKQSFQTGSEVDRRLRLMLFRASWRGIHA